CAPPRAVRIESWVPFLERIPRRLSGTRRVALAPESAGLLSALMSTFRVVIADDEPLSRERISQLLADEPAFAVAAACEAGPASAAAIRACAPDLVFLDVQMPGLDGFQVLEALSASEQPLIVFVTSFDDFAVRAFEVAALDYVLKPVDRDRFRGTLERAR